MKKIIALFVLSLVSYQGVAANNQTYSQQASNKVTENYLSVDTHKKYSAQPHLLVMRVYHQ